MDGMMVLITMTMNTKEEQTINMISLKKDWDYQPKLRSPKGHHVKRNDEHSILVDFISRRDEGSLMVAGHRGVGKTSSVIAAINDAIENTERIPVFIKATSIDLNENGHKADKKKTILQTLIRSLHKAVKDYDNNNALPLKETEYLYNKSLASRAYDEDQSGKTTTTKKTYKISMTNYITSAILFAMGLIYLVEPALQQYSWLILAPVAGGAAVTSYFHKYEKAYSSTQSYYRHDYDFADLQSEFEDLMEKYSRQNAKILFIIDEIDKIDDWREMVTPMKMLYNQGNALFIFITSPEGLGGVEKRRSMEYTLFSQLLFLKRPLFEEMEAFIDGIVQNSERLKNDTDYKNFRNYLCYESRTDFFDLYRVIRNHIKGQDDNGNPTIEITFSHYTQLTIANLQKTIGWMYEKKKRNDPSQQQVNDGLLDTLYIIVEAMEDRPNPKTITVKDDKITIGKTSIRYNNLYEMSAISDMFLLLTKQGYLVHDDQDTYTVIGKLDEFDPRGIFVEEEKTFIESYDKFKEMAVNFANIYSKFVKDQGVPFKLKDFDVKWKQISDVIGVVRRIVLPNDAKATYNNLTSREPQLVASETLQEHTDAIRTISGYLATCYINLLALILKKHLDDLDEATPEQTDIFNYRGMEKKAIPCIALALHSAKISRIVIIDSEHMNTLKDMERQTHSTDLIILLGHTTTISNYQKNGLVTDDVEVLKKKITDVFNDQYDESDHIGYVPEKDPELKDGEHETFLFAMRVPLCSDAVEKLLDLINYLSRG